MDSGPGRPRADAAVAPGRDANLRPPPPPLCLGSSLEIEVPYEVGVPPVPGPKRASLRVSANDATTDLEGTALEAPYCDIFSICL